MDEMPAPERRIVDGARSEIDRIDLELVRLLNRRARQVARIGEVKARYGEPVYQPDREERIFQRVLAANEGPLEDDAVKRLFERILDEARRLERFR